MRSMLQQLLTEQAKLINKLYDMEERVEALSSREILLDHENAHGCSLSSLPIIEANIEDNEKSLLEIERILYGSQHKGLMGSSKVEVEEKVEVEAQEVEYMGGYSTMHVVSPPKASLKKKGSCGEEALGYGNVENTLALDGYCLDPLFSPTIEKEIENTKGECTKTKKEISNGNHPIILEPPSCTMTLTPWRYEGGAIEYKVKCKGRTKPFAKVKAILSTELKEKGQRGIQEVMGKVILLELKDPPWSVNTPLSLT